MEPFCQICQNSATDEAELRFGSTFFLSVIIDGLGKASCAVMLMGGWEHLPKLECKGLGAGGSS